jgi:hypothetical protein
MDEAREEVERNESALAYRKTQLEEAQAELAGLGGFGGLLPALLGRRAAVQAELEARIKALNQDMLACRKRLIEARQKRASVARLDAAETTARTERDAELERFADRIRDSHHPLRETLLELEERLQAGADRLFDITDAFRACSGLTARVGEVGRITGHARSYAGYDLAGIPGAQTLAFLKTREAQTEATTLPEAIDRFNDACAVLGLAPMQIDVSKLPTGWTHIVADGLMSDYARILQISAYQDELATLKDLARDTALRLAEWRTTALAEQEDLIRQRRTLLDEALG